VNADQVIVLPNNKNIVMAANAAATVASKPVAVVPTTSVPAAFSALLAYDGASDDVEAVAQAMTEVADTVRTGEITVAVKDAKSEAGPITAGQIIAIVDDKEIEVIGESVDEVAERLADLLAQDAETLTLYAGLDYNDEALAAIATRIASAHPDLEVETYRGEQPLYPLIMSAE
jgi:hypothetical protein